jgi:hypothetical protein
MALSKRGKVGTVHHERGSLETRSGMHRTIWRREE